MTVSPSEVTFAVAADTGYHEQTRMLVESIRAEMPASQIVAFVPERSHEKMDSEMKGFFKDNSDVHSGSIPIPDYPLTALTKAFIIASEEYNSKYFLQVDSDILLLNQLELPSEPASEVLAKPTNLGSHYWASPDARDQWKELYSHFDADVPDQRLRGTFDGVRGFPIWNAGVIATTDKEFPRQWLERTREVLESGILGEDRFYAEQLSFSLLGTLEYDVTPLSVKQNYAQEYVFVPSDVQVFHYGDPAFLPFYIATPSTYVKMMGYWAGRYKPSISDGVRRCLNVIRGRGRRCLSRRRRLQIESLGAKTIGLAPDGIEKKIRSLYG
jgi:hypothetical protein